MEPLASPRENLGLFYDVVVVGSGYGASVSALRYAEAGHSVAVVERGREWPTGSFPRRMPDIRRELQLHSGRGRTGPATALFDMRLGGDMHVLVGCGLGGGSLINAGVVLAPDPRVFADEAWPCEFRSDGLLEAGFDDARRWLRPASDPLAREMTKFKALDCAAPAVRGVVEPAEVAVTFRESVNPAGVTQPACTRCGDCCSGCNVGAKNSTALTYLPAAKAAGAELYTELGVSHLTKSGSGTWRVHCGPSDDQKAEAIEIEARRVVLGAGTLGSSEILLRSKIHGLAISNCLGGRFSANGDIIAFGIGGNIPVQAVGRGHPPRDGVSEIGASVSGQITLKDETCLDHEMTIQEGVLPSPLAPLLPIFFLPGGRLLGAAHALLKGVYKGPLAHLSTYFVVSHDRAAGRLFLEDDRLRLVWPNAADEPVYGRVDDALEGLVGNSGGRYIKNPLAMTSVGSKPATAHPLGGAVIGRDASSGVVDHAGRVFSDEAGATSWAVHDGLTVVDGATIPRSLGCNPLLTIAALAERASRLALGY